MNISSVVLQNALDESADEGTSHIKIHYVVGSQANAVAEAAKRIVKGYTGYSRELSDAERDLRDAVNVFFGI